MSATLTWLDLTASDRDRMRQVLDLFKEQGTVDEMGLGSLRDALSEALFPGTSTIQTRLRYALFVPWIYRQLEARRVAASDVSAQLQKAEIDLIEPLLKNGTSQGVIGERSRGSLARRPSSVYWTALVRWGLFMHERHSGLVPHALRQPCSRARRGSGRRRPGHRPDTPTELASPHAGSPADVPPRGLVRPDAQGGRLSSGPPGRALRRHPARLARPRGIGTRRQTAASGTTALQGMPMPTSGTRSNSPAASPSTLEGMALLYNLLLAERFRTEHGGDDERIGGYRQEIAEWAAREAA